MSAVMMLPSLPPLWLGIILRFNDSDEGPGFIGPQRALKAEEDFRTPDASRYLSLRLLKGDFANHDGFATAFRVRKSSSAFFSNGLVRRNTIPILLVGI